MKHFSVIVACVMFVLFFAACEGNNSNDKKDTDTAVADDDNLLVEEDSIVSEEEPEGEDVDQKTDKDTVVKDDGPVVTDDGTVITDDDAIEPDDAMIEPDDATVETDDTIIEPDDSIIVPDDDTVTTYPITWCNLQSPTDPTITTGDELTIYGRVYVAGLTDLTTAVDSAEELLIEVGIGNADSDISTWNWGESNITPNPNNAVAPEIGNNDEYIFSAVIPIPAGEYDYTFRFSGDNGTSWIYCNANRSPNYNGTDETTPFDIAKVGHLTVQDEILPDDDAIVTDDAATDDVVTDDVVVDDTVTDDTVTDTVVTDADTATTLTVGWCNLQYPITLTVSEGDAFGDFYGRVYVAGVTDTTTGFDTDSRVSGEFGWGDTGTSAVDWDTWVAAAGNSSFVDNSNDEYMATIAASLSAGLYDYTFRFSADGGTTWIYCNSDGGTTNPSIPYDLTENGHLTVETAYVDPCAPVNSCTDLHKTVCTDTNTDGVAECACDTGYTFDGGSVCINSKQVNCAANPAKPANSDDVIEQVTVTYNGTIWSDPATCTVWVCADGFHWNETEEACLDTLTIGWCNLQYPTDITIEQGADLTVYGRVYVAGITDLTVDVDAMSQIIGQLSGNPSQGVDAATWPWDGWMDLDPNPDNETSPDIGDNDEYMITVPVMADPGEMDITIRFSGDSGNSWTYCNANRQGTEGYNGTDAGHPYDPAKHGHLTVTPGYIDPCAPVNSCTDLHKTVCTDTNTDGVAECACDTGYTFDGGSVCINSKQVDCAANPAKPANSDDVIEQVTVTYNGTIWSDPATCTVWVCADGFHWNETEEACLDTLTIGWCNLQYPTDASFYRGETVAVYGRVYVLGVTDQTADVDVAAQLVVQIGSGAAGNSAIDGMYWGPMEPNPANHLIPGIDGNDEYQYIGPVTEMIGDWDMSVRVSGDSGATWTYCNANREPTYNGTDAENPYDLLKNGHFTVTTPCDEGFCDEPHKSVCDDGDNEPYYICSCDTDYHDDGDGNCVSDTRNDQPCIGKLANSVYNTATTITQTWDGDSWEPSTGAIYNEEASATECRFKCADYYYVWDGDSCEDFDECTGGFNSCVIDDPMATCTNTSPGNDCGCSEGFELAVFGGVGSPLRTCKDIDECTTLSNPCDTYDVAATCGNTIGGYTCNCSLNYTSDGGTCVPDGPRTENCVDNKPAHSHWIASGDYNGDGTVDQAWTAINGWQPSADECPWACDVDHHVEYDPVYGPICDPSTRTVACTNELPTGADWVEIAPYDGSGNLIQTWVGPGDEDWEPADNTCPWDCTDPLYHKNLEVNQCLLTLTIDWCTLQFPPTVTADFGTLSEMIYGQVYIADVTSASTLVAGVFTPFKPQLKAQLGYGGRNTDPVTWSHWMDTTPNVKDGNNEEYKAAPLLDMYPGLYDYAYRFSGDSGTTWNYCDTTGTTPTDPYVISSSGKLTVTCITDGHCSSNLATPLCNAGQCVECAGAADCPTWAECNASFECKPQAGRCGNKNDDCTDPAKPVCDSVNNNCVECLDNSDCVDLAKPICSSSLNTCGPNAVYFSEYMEGTSNNKALEVYNGTPDAIDLTKYRVMVFFNGSTSSGSTLVLNNCGSFSTLLASGMLKIVNSASALTALTSIATCLITGAPSVVAFNGDDVIVLEYTPDGTSWIVIDIIGIIGTDPGTSWSVAGDTTGTENNTVVRKSIITQGNINWLLSAGTTADDSEWIVYAQDTVSYFGSR